jgi:hypothetical protein
MRPNQVETNGVAAAIQNGDIERWFPRPLHIFNGNVGGTTVSGND